MSKMEYVQLLDLLMDRVPDGSLTTYGELSVWAYGNPRAAQAIVAMLNAAVRMSSSNARYTNRVVSKNGAIADVNGQLNQLRREGIRIVEGKVDMRNSNIIRFDVGA